LDGSNSVAPADNTAFPLLQSATVKTSTSNGPDGATNAAGATLTFLDINSVTKRPDLAISIPNLGVNNVALTDQDTLGIGDAEEYEGALGGGKTILVEVQTFDYVSMGLWSILPTGNPLVSSNAAFGVSGYTTPSASMPTGTATYGGSVIGLVGVPQGGSPTAAALTGRSSLSVDFTTGEITGDLTGMVATPLAGGTPEPWNTVALSATISGATFAGTTSVASMPASGAFLLASSATGNVNGGFYGPAGQGIGAVWSLYDGVNSAFGTLVAQNPVVIAPTPTPTYIVGAPAAASVGTTPPLNPAQGLQQASAGGSNFSDTATFPSAGTVFAATQTALQVTPTYVIADDATNAAGSTMTLVDAATGAYELKIPSLGIDADISQNAGSDLKLPGGDYLSLNNLSPDGTPGLLDYVELNQWTLKDSSDNLTTNTGWTLIGYQTPAAGMPTSGSATYSGTGNVFGTVFIPVPAPNNSAQISGDGSLTANFATGAVTGMMTNMVTGLSHEAWNTVSIVGTISGDTFSGATTANSITLSEYTLNNATGAISGGFYGPSANEVGAVWTLYDSNNDSAAVGVIGAPEPTGAPTIGALTQATDGTSPPTTAVGGFEQAEPAGPTFAPDQVPTGTVFSVVQSAAAIMPGVAGSGDGATISADTVTNAQGATLTVVNGSGASAFANGAELKIPGLGIDVIVPAGGAPITPGSNESQAANGLWASIPTFGTMQYTLYGQWSVSDTETGVPTGGAWFVGGYQTPVASMPTSGTATYNVAAEGTVYAPAAAGAFPDVTTGSLEGGAGTLTVNFQTGSLAGSITGMTAYVSPPPTFGPTPVNTPWNNISVSATLAGAGFSGTVATTSNPTSSNAAGALVMGSGTGTVAGRFYGPAANETGAVWSLSDGTRTATGVITGALAPSDRRLKRDIEVVPSLAGEPQLYSYRYLGDHRRFVGVMAQDLLADPRFAEAVVRTRDCFLLVDYQRLGIAVDDIDGMREAGAGAMRIYQARAGAAA
jgi:hypothetical protein